MSRGSARLYAASLLLTVGVTAGWGQDPPRLDVWVVGAPGSQWEALRRAVEKDLARTPRRHGLAFATSLAAGEPAGEGVLAVLAVAFDPVLERPRLLLAGADDAVTPGWLVHAVLRAGSTVGLRTDVVDSRSSMLGQLVQRSTRRHEPSSADSALGHGLPALTLVLPAADEPATRLLAATLRRLDGLDGYPLFEDEFLVALGRVLLRRDLYWLGLAVWLALYWRGRSRPGREFRWLLLAAWLVAPVYASLLLLFPALVASWHPTVRWPAALALLPSVAFLALLAITVAGPAALRVSGIPALLVTLALGAFVWHHLIRPPQHETAADA